MNKKTILIHVFDSNIVRNMLRTDVLKVLLSSGHKVVLLMQPRRIDVYKKEFSHKNIEIIEYPAPNPNIVELVGWFIAKNSIHTYNVRQKQEELLDKKRERNLRLPKYLVARVVFAFSRFFFFRAIVKKVVAHCFDHSRFNLILEKYRPDIVFLPTIFTTNDIRLLKACKKKKIQTVGMIKSWDNLTGKDPMLIHPDWLIVHNQKVAEEAMVMHKYPQANIFVSGIPQLDVFAKSDFPSSRTDFVAKLGLDPNKKIVLYTAMGSWIVTHEKEIIEILADIVSNKLPFPAQLLVRLHPAYASEDEKLKGIKNVILDRPGGSNFQFNSWRADWEFDIEDTRHLVSSIAHSAVVVNSGSTTTIDAACLDKPIINICFDGYAGESEVQSRSVRRLLCKEHYMPIIKSGGVQVVYNIEELTKAIIDSIAEPSKYRDGRLKIVSEQCYKLDGNSGKRIGEYILQKLL